ncbi:putative MPP superfamily phosphohydrolase [Metabacillus crassostreae]|uniref:metallophosphoesterase n=1 Tax=Metabacillus crassostreae TaxID=929098 RepID=UPI00195764E5|nr:metallophosphoesterase [Metabacillus crassostreae]MBM7602497.1 putative MPP superfamily phosphohydrolase [Metabacillus crassostreae]
MKKLNPVMIVVATVILLILGTIWSNNSVVVDNVTIDHDRLPAQFDNYKILQISDLHGREFGRNQEKLVDLITKQKYELVVFTGDYASDDEEDLQPLENLLKGMPKNKEMYFILGDKDADNSTAALKEGNRFYDLFIKYDVKPLYPGQEIKKGEQSIWLKTNPYVVINEVGANETPERLIEASEQFNARYKQQQNPFTIEIAHRPTEIDKEDSSIREYRTSELNDKGEEWRHWDVSLNGHTRGGQFQLPIIGPLYAPNHGFLPGKVNVTGVHTVDNHTQYVNNGLGVSGPWFAQFRLFNRPSIGLITLRAK